MEVPGVRVRIEEDVALAPLTTFGIGGNARFFARVSSESELVEAVTFSQQRGLRLLVLGGGSNLLVHDSGFDGLVLKIEIAGDIFERPAGEMVDVIAGAGVDWDQLVLHTCKRGLTGMECLAGIPGTVGGTPVQNVGAYGQEVAQTIVSVRVLDRESLTFADLPAAECGFAYRTSRFNTTDYGRYIVTRVTFRLAPGCLAQLTYKDLREAFPDRLPTPVEVYGKVREIRHGKGMLIVQGEQDCRSAGSFFKNPVVAAAVYEKIAAEFGDGVPHWPASGGVKLAAAWLLEKAGFIKGFADGAAGVSSRHTLALINRGGASYSDIVRLRERIRCEVAERFGVKLEQEPVEVV